MMLAADYPFLDVLWTMLIFFLWVCWFMLLFHVIGDVFRRRDVGGGTKMLWLIFVLFVPFLGTFVYLIANSVPRRCSRAEPSARRSSTRSRPRRSPDVQEVDEAEEVRSPAAAVRASAMPPQ